MNKLFTVSLALIIGLFFFSAPQAEAQQLRSPGQVGVGVQAGQPSGLTVKVYNPTVSYDFLAAWDLDDSFFFNVHALYNRHLGQTETVHVFFGPGVYAGFQDDDDAFAGISGSFGFDILFMPLEFFAQVTPRLDLTPGTDTHLGGGVGFRFYF